MSLQNFTEHQSFLEAHLVTKSNGASFKRIDFHFHTPASNDYHGKGVTYEDIAKKLKSEKIDAIFVTDHNCWEGISKLKEACVKEDCPTIIFPGVELTLKTTAICLLSEGKKINIVKFHCLALLPPTADYEARIKSLITNNHKDEAILKLGPVERVVSQPLEEIADIIHGWGGIFIPAHLHQDKGLKSRSIDDLYEDSITVEYLEKYFDAVEIRKPENDIFHGEFKTKDGVTVPKISCVLGSDSHELETIGREVSYIAVENLDFENIKQALLHKERTRYTPATFSYSRILSLCVDGAFMGQKGFTFSPQMNSLIGAKGSGKTAVIELIRFALGYSAPNTPSQYFEHLLGPAGKVSLLVIDGKEQEYLFSRRMGDPKPTVSITDGTTIDRDTIVPSLFNVEIRGWGETTKLAESAEEQLRLIDNYDSNNVIRTESNRLTETQASLAGKYEKIVASYKTYKVIKSSVDQLTLKEKSLQKLISSNLDVLQTKKEQRDRESALMSKISTLVDAQSKNSGFTFFSAEIDAQIKSLKESGAAGSTSFGTEIDAVQGLKTTLDDINVEVNEIITKSFKEFIDSLAIHVESIRKINEDLDTEYQTEFNKLTPNEQAILLERNKVVKEIAIIEGERTRLSSAWKELSDQREDYAKSLDIIQTCVDNISKRRVEIVAEINSILENNKSDTKVQFKPKSKVVGNLDNLNSENCYNELAKKYRAISESDIHMSTLINEFGVARSEFSLKIVDEPEVHFKMYDSTWKPSSQLSAGQKSTAVLPLLLSTANGPIIMDQPEDNLDNKYIGSTVVNMLSKLKGVNQLIITSHNASIVVMTDSELIIEMEDENSKSKVKAHGFLTGPNSPIKESVLNILDGGELALKSRFKKYGIN